MVFGYLPKLLEFSRFARSWLTCKGYKPFEAKVRCTLRCDSRCKYCAIGQQALTVSPFEMSTAQYRVLFRQLKKFGTKSVTFIGGEPLLREDLPILVCYAKQFGFTVNVVTNGHLLTEELARKLIHKVDSINFSVDSANREIHDYIRAPGSWNKVTKALATLTYLRRKHKSSIKISINAVISNVNFREIDRILDMKALFDFDSIAFSPLTEYASSGLSLTVNEVRYFNEYIAPKIEEKAKKYGLQVNAYPFGRSENIIDQDDRPKSTYKSCHCFVPWTNIEVMPNGDVIPCGYAGLDMVFGNLLSQPFLSVWNGKKFVEFRRRCRPPKFTMCKSCWCHLNTNIALMQQYCKVPRVFRKTLEFMS